MPLFFGCDPDALAAVCGVLRRALFLPEEFLCRQGEIVTELYLLESGIIVETIYPDDDGDGDSDCSVDADEHVEDMPKSFEDDTGSDSGNGPRGAASPVGDDKSGMKRSCSFKMDAEGAWKVCVCC